MNRQWYREWNGRYLLSFGAVRIFRIMQQPLQIQPRPIYRAERPVRDPSTSIPEAPACVACLRPGALTRRTRRPWMSQKSCDLKAIPFADGCHEAFDADRAGLRNGID